MFTSVLTTTELSLPSHSLAIIEPTPPSLDCTVFSVVFLGVVSWKLPLTSHLNAASFDPAWMHGASATPPPFLRIRFSTRKWYDSFHSQSHHRPLLFAAHTSCNVNVPRTTSVISWLTSNGGSGWCVHCDEAWEEWNRTDWPAMHGAYCMPIKARQHVTSR